MSFRMVEETVRDARIIAIVGHGKPDSDCIGSVVGLALYFQEIFPDRVVIPILEEFHEKFRVLKGTEQVVRAVPEGMVPDVLFVCDCSEPFRIGAGSELAGRGIRTVVIDHHATNSGFGDESAVKPESSSTCELLLERMDRSRITKDCAACLYVGIVGDTGVFRHSCTSPATMRAAADLMEYGIDPRSLIRETYDLRLFSEAQILGAVLSGAVSALDGRVVIGTADRRMQETFGVTPKNLDSIPDILMNIKGVEAAVFLYETDPGVFKASLRSGDTVAVSETAKAFGGGGHVRASGCTLMMGAPEARFRLTRELAKQLGAPARPAE